MYFGQPDNGRASDVEDEAVVAVHSGFRFDFMDLLTVYPHGGGGGRWPASLLLGVSSFAAARC